MQLTDTITGTDGAGNPAVVTITRDLPETPEQTWPPRPVIGATVNHKDFPFLGPDGRNQGARFCRVFSYPGDGILPWTHTRRQLPAGVAEFHSFKDWNSDAEVLAQLKTLLDTMPAHLTEQAPLLPELRPYDPDGYAVAESDGLSFLLTWAHEGEDNMIAAGIPAREWRRRHRLVYRTVREHRNGHRVGYMPIQTSIWTEMKSQPGKPKGDGDPFAWWPGVGDFAGWDAYVSSVTDRPPSQALYRDPVPFLATAVELANGTGRRLFLPELGVIRQGAPADTGALRADWIRRVLSYCEQLGVAGVAWWDSLGANDRDFRLSDRPSQMAWQDAIAGRI